ncbi:MAG TPA: hypothetical protein PLO37_00280 [Candidatus Hydrogenedentes bacterium]|nr:hypothetical protein [Candidatus Hydrogenedentota bacterium]HPG65249.1 hypothetical protein [Candidatus Hydrogenedentota bacterium]
MELVVGILGAIVLCAASDSGPYALPAADHEHVEEFTGPARDYEVSMGGYLDGFNSVRYLETYGAHMRQESGFEPNDYVALENVGNVDIVNARLVVNGRRNWHSAEEILAGILKPGMDDAEKAMAVFRFCSSIEVQAHDNNRRVGPPFPAEGTEHDNLDVSHPSRNTFQERANPVKAANAYYCSGCSLSAANFVILCRCAGLTARAVWMCPLNTYQTHCVGEVWHDGDWHLFDPERRSFYLERDNLTVASYRTIHENPELVERTHDGGFSAGDMKSHAEDYRKYYPPRVMPVEQWLSRVDLTLRPGEQIVWRWSDDGRYRYGANTRGKSDLPPYQLANGKLIYRPRLSGEPFFRGAVSIGNLVSDSSGVHPESVTCTDLEGAAMAAPAGTVVYRVTAPYPIVGGLVGGTFQRREAARTSISVAVGETDWIEVWHAEDPGEDEVYVRIDHILDPLLRPAIYTYYIRFELKAQERPTDAVLMAAYIETDLQMAATSLPALSVGKNTVKLGHESGPEARVRIQHGWHENDDHHPPEPPAVVSGSHETLVWDAPRDTDGDAMAAYHVQISGHPDMSWPVSPNLDRIIDADTAEWPVPEGWLIDGRPYYWRVRAQDARGVWSAWSTIGTL